MTQRAKARHKSKARPKGKAATIRPQRSHARSAQLATSPPKSSTVHAAKTLTAEPATLRPAPAGPPSAHGRQRPVRRWMWLNSLALVMFGAFLLFWMAQSVFGWQVRNEELEQAGQLAQSYWHYLGTGHFAEATFENWESEFLQMGSYVLLTAFLVQQGSPESKPLDQTERREDKPEHAGKDSPRLSRVRGLPHALYRNSLSLVLFAFFGLSFLGHLLGGTAAYNEEQALQTGAPAINAWDFLGTSDFWFQSMQNWQSEFLAVGSLVVLGIKLRQRGSPESKPVTAPHSQTGE